MGEVAREGAHELDLVCPRQRDRDLPGADGRPGHLGLEHITGRHQNSPTRLAHGWRTAPLHVASRARMPYSA